MPLPASDVALACTVGEDYTSAAGNSVDDTTPALVVEAHGDMSRVRIPPLLKDVKISLTVLHLCVYLYDFRLLLCSGGM